LGLQGKQREQAGVFSTSFLCRIRAKREPDEQRRHCFGRFICRPVVYRGCSFSNFLKYHTKEAMLVFCENGK